jgi:glycosyltransferase involved in cell wall biosynthesis
MDRVVCVSDAQAELVRRAGVSEENVVVIPNAIDPGRFANPDPAYRERLCALAGGAGGPIVAAAGRLSPDKGFSVLIQSVRQVVDVHKSARFVLFGDGPLRAALSRQIVALGLSRHFTLAGFRQDLDSLLPFVDLFVQSSFTEGMPNVILEAMAARVPIVATAVGGTPEVVRHGITGCLVPPGDAPALARAIGEALSDSEKRRGLAGRGFEWVREKYTFDAQSRRYRSLAESLATSSRILKSVAMTLPSNSA